MSVYVDIKYLGIIKMFT